MAKITIDFFELAFLAEACIPPVPIARGCFWDRLIDQIYHELSHGERAKLYGWMLRNDRFNVANENCAWFAARYDPANQYQISFRCQGESGKVQCFKKNERFYKSQNVSIAKEFITKIEKIELDLEVEDFNG